MSDSLARKSRASTLLAATGFAMTRRCRFLKRHWGNRIQVSFQQTNGAGLIETVQVQATYQQVLDATGNVS